MEGDREEAKQEARDSGETWADEKDDWEAEWIECHWGDVERAATYAKFKQKWEREHPGVTCPELTEDEAAA
jgi:hypothetical protein